MCVRACVCVCVYVCVCVCVCLCVRAYIRVPVDFCVHVYINAVMGPHILRDLSIVRTLNDHVVGAHMIVEGAQYKSPHGKYKNCKTAAFVTCVNIMFVKCFELWRHGVKRYRKITCKWILFFYGFI